MKGKVMFDFNITVDVLINGKPVRKYAHNDNTFVEAKKQSQYSLRIKNDGFQRRLVVVSVDGLNVINGQPAGVSKVGYVIGGYSSLEIKGFRTSLSEVHPFVFNRKDQSYAAKSIVSQGDTSSCGAIGVEVYSEKVKSHQYVVRKCFTSPTAPIYDTSLSWENGSLVATQENTSHYGGGTSVSTSCVPSEKRYCSYLPDNSFDMGTAFSSQPVCDEAVATDFDIETKLTTIVIYYASRNALINMGIRVDKHSCQAYLPNAFPHNFCPLPRN